MPERPDHPRLSSRHRARLILGGTLVGAVFGPLAFITMSALAGKYGALEPFFAANRSATLAAIGRSGALLLYMIVALAAAVGMAVKLVRVLERRAAAPPRPFYLRAAGAGALSGTGAVMLTSIAMLMLSFALGEGPPVMSRDAVGVTLFVYGIVFGAFAGVGAVLLTLPFIAIAGTLYGLLFGRLVRLLAG